jgi:hypothetical protein
MQLWEQEETSSRYEPAYSNCKTQAKRRAWGTLRVIFIGESVANDRLCGYEVLRPASTAMALDAD